MLTDSEKQALEQLETERERRIEAKIDSGEAVLRPPIVLGGAQPGPRTIEKDDEGREIYRGFRTEEGRIERIDAIITGVPRAGRDIVDDDELRVAPKAARKGSPSSDYWKCPSCGGTFPAEITIHKCTPPVVDQPKSPPPQSAARNDALENPARRIWAQVEAPSLQNPVGTITEALYKVEDGMVRVADLEGRLLGSAEIKPGENAEVIARKILREKTAGGDFYRPVTYPPIPH